MDDMRQQAIHNGTGWLILLSFPSSHSLDALIVSSSGPEIVDEDVIEIQRCSKDQSFRLVTNSGKEYYSKSLILSTGAQALWLNAKNEETFKGQDPTPCVLILSIGIARQRDLNLRHMRWVFLSGLIFFTFPLRCLLLTEDDRIRKCWLLVEVTQPLKKLYTFPISAPRLLLFPLPLIHTLFR